jgi:hypothetical protein
VDLQYQLMATERGGEVLGLTRDLASKNMESAKEEARLIFANARRMDRASGTTPPQAVRILEYEIEMWRWTFTEEQSAPRKKGP